MIEISFLAYIPDPFSLRRSLYMILEPKCEARTVLPHELSGYGKHLMTYDTLGLVDDLRILNHSPPRHLLDIGDALRLGVGRPKNDGGEKLWNFWSALKVHFDDKADARAFELMVNSRVGRPEPLEQTRLLRETLIAMRRQWDWLRTELVTKGELERLISVEWPLQSLFAYRQFMGVRVDSRGAGELLNRISSVKYAEYRTVAKILNKSPSGLTFWNIHPYLGRTDVGHLAELDPGGRLQDAFELAATHSEFAASFLNLVKASRDETIVKRAIGPGDRVYPVFHVLGTISGRILVSDPHLQQLRRRYRSLILPEPNCRLVYLDYAQFEPGILAGLSEDDGLIEAYNKGDVYSALAESVFGDVGKRAVAKRVYLAFSYGMTNARIATLISGIGDFEPQCANYAKKIDIFFLTFPGLEDYRIRQQNRLVEEGFVASLQGNRRVRTGSGMLTHKEKRWALNHPVQSTASLVFKEAMIGIARMFGVERIILPIHDAVLLQFDDDNNFDHNVQLAREIMIAAFSRHFPSIDVRVTAGSFVE